MPNRSIRDERVDYSVGRPKVGPADPATVRRELKKRLAEKEPAQQVTSVKTKPAEKPSSTVFGAARLLKNRSRQIDDEIDKASK